MARLKYLFYYTYLYSSAASHFVLCALIGQMRMAQIELALDRLARMRPSCQPYDPCQPRDSAQILSRSDQSHAR